MLPFNYIIFLIKFQAQIAIIFNEMIRVSQVRTLSKLLLSFPQKQTQCFPVSIGLCGKDASILFQGGLLWSELMI